MRWPYAVRACSSKAFFRSYQKPAKGVVPVGADAVALVEHPTSYQELLSSFAKDRALSKLLSHPDAPHPFKVYNDIKEVHGGQVFTLDECLHFFAHCHILLRMLSDDAHRDSSAVADVASPAPGEIVVKPSVDTEALHWAYHDTQALWESMLTEQRRAREPRVVGGLLRCTAVVADQDYAEQAFNACSDRVARNRSLLILNGMMWTYAEARQMEKVSKMWDVMRRNKVKPDADSFEACVHGGFQVHEMATVLQTWKEMTRNNVLPRDTTYEMTVAGCLDNKFLNHAWMFYHRYRESSTPTPYLQHRMSQLYSHSVIENAKEGSKIKYAVDQTPHLNYKMLIDFCRMRSLRDVVLPDHVPAPQPHYFSPVDGSERGMEIDYYHLLPRSGKGWQFKAFTSHSNRMIPGKQRDGSGRKQAVFVPPGAREPLREAPKGMRKRIKQGYAGEAGARAKGKVIHDTSGRKGSGMWCQSGFSWPGPRRTLTREG